METVVFTAEWQMKPDYTDMQKGIRHYHREILTISIHVPRTFLFFENLCYTTCSILTYVYGKNSSLKERPISFSDTCCITCRSDTLACFCLGICICY